MDIQEIKAYMKANKITYEQLADMTKLSISTIKKIFSGISKYPRVDTIRIIVTALGLDEQQKSPPSELTEGEKKLIELFNKIPEDKRDFVLQVIQVALDKQQ